MPNIDMRIYLIKEIHISNKIVTPDKKFKQIIEVEFPPAYLVCRLLLLG